MTKRKKARLLKFPKPVIPDDTQFIETLVWVLDQAQRGRVKGYAMVYLVENDDGSLKMTEAATTPDDENSHAMLGGIRRMEFNYMRRKWPASDS